MSALFGWALTTLAVVAAVGKPLTETQTPLNQPVREELSDAELAAKWDFNWGFSGISTFGHLEHQKCLVSRDIDFDIAVIGAPFDSAASYRPGARMGPRAIRAASDRHLPGRSFHPVVGINPYYSWAKILDCGDVPITPLDKKLALQQMDEAFMELNMRRPASRLIEHPKLLILGGDHSVALPALRALREAYQQPIALLHFDAHLDSLHPTTYPSVWFSDESQFNHGSMFWQASNEGLLLNTSSVHSGIRTRLSGTSYADYHLDDAQGFLRQTTDDIDEKGVSGIVKEIMEKIGTEVPVYLSIDIDVLDPAFAAGTGAPESGGWTSRELIKILRGVEDLNLVGADIVEVAPAYDTPGGDTAFTAAVLGYEILTSMVRKGLQTKASMQ